MVRNGVRSRRARVPHHHRSNLAVKGDAPLYRRWTMRHLDMLPPTDDLCCFYVAAYGPLCHVDDGAEAAPAAAPMTNVVSTSTAALGHMMHNNGSGDFVSGDDMEAAARRHQLPFRAHFDSEICTELMDALWAPETIVPEHKRMSFGAYVRETLRVTEQGPMRQRLAPLTPMCRAEYMFRAALLAALRGSVSAPPAAYFTYAALSPLHERTWEEIVALVQLRAAPMGGFAPEVIWQALAWLDQQGLVGVPECVRYVAVPDYDWGLTRRVSALLSHAFLLAPGQRHQQQQRTWLHPAQCANLRRTVHRYRFARLCDQIAHQYESMTTVPRRNVQPRPLTEYAVLADVLCAHGIGFTDGATLGAAKNPMSISADAATTARPSVSPIVKIGLPPHIKSLVTQCSSLDLPWAAPPLDAIASSELAPTTAMTTPISCRSRSNSSSSAQTTTGSSSAASTPRATNPWSEYTNMSRALDALLEERLVPMATAVVGAETDAPVAWL